MKLEHSQISNFNIQELVTFVIILFMISIGKNYYINGSNMGNIDVGQGSSQIQI